MEETYGLSRSLGARIKQQRKFKHMTAELLASKIGVSLSFLWELERGNKKPSLPTFVRIANTLEISADDLLCDSLNMSTAPQLNNLSKKLDCLSKEQLKMVELTIDSMLLAFRDMNYDKPVA